MDLFLKDRQNDRTFIIAAWMNRCSDSLAEREQAKRQLCHALERQWRNREHYLLLTPLQYSFWRYDADGYKLLKDWSSSNTLNCGTR